MLELAFAVVGESARRSLRRFRMRRLLRELTPQQCEDAGISRARWTREAAKWFWEI